MQDCLLGGWLDCGGEFVGVTGEEVFEVFKALEFEEVDGFGMEVGFGE